jgi:murein L,D-transpeptidase YcbB/YkuD
MMSIDARTASRPFTALAFLIFLLPCDLRRDPSGKPNERVAAVIGSAETPVLQLKSGDTLHLSAPVVAFYRERGYRQAWTDYDEVLDQGVELLETMGRSAQDGFEPDEYRYPLAAKMLEQVEEDSLEESAEPAQMGEVDLVLSEVFARYARHLAGGALDPKVAGLDWQIEREEPDVKSMLERLADGQTPEELVDSVRPQVPEYRAMMAALARYREIEKAGGWEAVSGGVRRPEVGSSSAGALRRRLIAERDPAEVELARRGEATPDVFDAALKQALVHFQERHGVEPDGALGEATLAELNAPVSRRIAELKLNMDRWRWLPRDLGDLYVMVNVAGFELEVVENDSAILAMNVVVGKDASRTLIFRDTMENIVINPYWNVPPDIQKNELIPAVRRDPSYLDRNNFEVLRGNRRVSASQIDLGSLRSGAYTFRQKPGGDNALGQVKFLFPNDANIYLHDTPAQRLFSQRSRAFSHGCIRVEKPVELAKLIMSKATDLAPDQYEQLRARPGEQWIRLARPIPVYILYFTAYANRDGSVSFHPDIYERDRLLEGSPAARRVT